MLHDGREVKWLTLNVLAAPCGRCYKPALDERFALESVSGTKTLSDQAI